MKRIQRRIKRKGDANIVRVFVFFMRAAPTVIREVGGVRRVPRRGSSVLGSRNQRSRLWPGKLVRRGVELLVLLPSTSNHLNGDCVVH